MEVKKLCLARDENRCAITRYYDVNMAEKLPEEERREVETVETVCAPIIPFSIAPQP